MSDKDIDILRMLRENDARMSLTEAKEVARKNYGPAKPSSWPNNVPFFDATALLWVYYDGTRWLSAEEFQCDLQPYSRNPMPIAAGVSTTVLIAPQRTDYATYYLRSKAYLDVITLNNGTNYWGFSLIIGSTVVYSANTSADAAGAGLNKEDTAAQVCAGTAFSTAVVTKTGAPGTVQLAFSYWYRLVIP